MFHKGIKYLRDSVTLKNIKLEAQTHTHTHTHIHTHTIFPDTVKSSMAK